MLSEKAGAARDQNAFLKVHESNFASHSANGGKTAILREDCHIEVELKSTFRLERRPPKPGRWAAFCSASPQCVTG
jgi:hypothetical protein